MTLKFLSQLGSLTSTPKPSSCSHSAAPLHVPRASCQCHKHLKRSSPSPSPSLLPHPSPSWPLTAILLATVHTPASVLIPPLHTISPIHQHSPQALPQKCIPNLAASHSLLGHRPSTGHLSPHVDGGPSLQARLRSPFLPRLALQGGQRVVLRTLSSSHPGSSR